MSNEVKYRFSLVACARWEETDIQEWVAYHRSIGFEHIYLYSNDDDPGRLFHAVAPWVIGPDPFITFRHWPVVGAQMEIYMDFLRERKHETEWFSFLDIDEFIVLPGVNDIHRFMRGYVDSVDCLYLNWFTYGNCGRSQRAPGSTLISYPRRSAKANPHTKHICRSAAIDERAIRGGYWSGYGSFHHFLDNYRLDGLRCADVLRIPTDGYSSAFPQSSHPFIDRPGFSEAVLETGYIAHFQFKSEADFLRRWRRGGFDNGEMMRDLYKHGLYRAVLDTNNAVYDSRLAVYWWNYTEPAMRFRRQVPHGSVALPNVALLKPSFQSSIHEPGAEEPADSTVADGGNNGVRTGTFGFHTQYQPEPWWQVDLLSLHRISEIHVYNRADNAGVARRSARLRVSVSTDQAEWAPVFERTDGEPFGSDRTPLVIRLSRPEPWRWVRLSLPGTGFLHLDEVEVYGEPVAVGGA